MRRGRRKRGDEKVTRRGGEEGENKRGRGGK